MSSYSAPVILSDQHDVSAFDCGKESLDEFLKLHALSRQKARLSRTYVVTDGSLKVVAYYTLAHISVARDEAPKKIGRGMPDSIPALLLARLAIDTEHQGKRLGISLLTDSIRRTWVVMEASAAPVRLFVVDAKDDQARSFYERQEMLSSPVNPMRLFLSYKEIQSLIQEA
jgi:hypothetical protein